MRSRGRFNTDIEDSSINDHFNYSSSNKIKT